MVVSEQGTSLEGLEGRRNCTGALFETPTDRSAESRDT